MSEQSIAVPIALFAWIPAVLLLFAIFPPRRAVIISFICAWLFLPMASYQISDLPDYTKMSATCVGVLLGTVLLDAGRLSSFRFRLLDIPVIVWCLCPLSSSISNGLGLYDGFSGILNQVIVWGIPYFIGRLYFGDLSGLRELALGVFIGGLVYVPFCLYEIRMSPQLHRIVYGYHQHAFGQTMRWGGYRPTVFMQHGLMVSAWMATASLVGVWLWFSGELKHLWRIPALVLVPIQLGTTILCKSTGALFLLAFGIVLLFATHWTRLRIFVVCALLLFPAYLIARTAGYDPNTAVVMATLVSDERAASLQGRINSEILLVERALEKPVFGWGTWGRNRVRDERGKDIAAVDSAWIIILGHRGLIGLGTWTTVLLLGAGFPMLRIQPGQWRCRAYAPTICLATVVLLHAYDSLLNGMFNPVYIVAIGGLTGLVAGPFARPDDGRLGNRSDG